MPSRPRASNPRRLCFWLVGTLAAGGWGGPGIPRAGAQAESRDPTRPILVLNPGGHGGEVRALAFDDGGSRLFSAGADKVVHAWERGPDGWALARTIRPPIWRGLRGSIHALALGPRLGGPDAPRFLAVAGHGTQSTAGGIAIYRDPGAGPAGGDLAAHLDAGLAAEPNGHWKPVTALAFDPTGRYLASGSRDATVRVWDWRLGRTLAVLRGHGDGPVEALAFAPDGSRLVSGGADGSVALWDTGPGTLEALAREAAGPAALRERAERAGREALRARVEPAPRSAVTAIGVSPDGRWAVVGRDDGRVLRFDAGGLQGGVAFPPTAGRARVLAMAISPDGSRLATSLLREAEAPPTGRPRYRSEVEFRALPDGRPVGVLPPPVDGVVRALAFAPDGRSLAQSGGDDPSVLIRDLARPGSEPARLGGRGRGVWEVGFSPDGRRLAFSWSRDDGPAPPAAFWAFDLRGRALGEVDRRGLRLALRDWEGWSVRPAGGARLRAVDGRGVSRDVDLDPDRDGRWWSYSWLPPTPGHPGLALAVGTDRGVAVFALDPGTGAFRRSRSLAGHAGAVLALAPSPDGAWLATGSADQTVRLWPLAGSDAIPPFGATFAPGPGGPVVAAVAPGGYAARMGMEPGDEVAELYLDAARVAPAAVDRLDALGPDARAEFRARRKGRVVELGTTKRDDPALSLFVGSDREWVFWSPYGYYDSSVAGDRALLGWHRNGSRPGESTVDFRRPTDYVAADRFEKELRRPDVIDALLATGEVGRALSAVPPAPLDAPGLVGDDFPPRLALAAEGPSAPGRRVLDVPDLDVLARAASEAGAGAARLVGSIRFLVDGHLQHEVRPGRPGAEAPARLAIPPGVHKVVVVAANDRGRERSEGLVVEYRPGPAAPRPAREPRSVAIAFGADAFPEARSLPPIPFADRDARELGRFFAGLAARAGRRPEPSTILAGTEATSGRLAEAVDALDSAVDRGDLGVGDTAFVFVEGHFLKDGAGGRLLGADAAGAFPHRTWAGARRLAEALGRLAGSGCRVMVLIDGEHEFPAPPAGRDARADEWARELNRRGVVAFLASTGGPGRRLPTAGHGAFARAVLDSQALRSRPGLPAGPGPSMALGEFRDAVEAGTRRLAGPRAQSARCYFPESIDPATPLFDPNAPAPGEAAR